VCGKRWIVLVEIVVVHYGLELAVKDVSVVIVVVLVVLRNQTRGRFIFLCLAAWGFYLR
jgi:hypothetical protein